MTCWPPCPAWCECVGDTCQQTPVTINAAVRDAIPRAADAVEAVVEGGPEAAMNRFNTRSG